jgi:hypothetical protein
VTDTVTDSNGAVATAQVEVTTLGSAYAPLTPTRILDTRKGVGAPQGAVPAGGTVKLLVARNTEYLPPPGDMNAAVVNITVVNPTGNGCVTAYADGTTRPGTSTLNYTKGQTVANSAFFNVEEQNGGISLYNGGSAGADVILDVSGYFQSSFE